MKYLNSISAIFFLLIGLLATLLVSGINADSQPLKEKDYQAYFAEWIDGETEVMLDDWSRVDILTEVYAIEVDFSHKWAEGIGQALFYAEKTGRIPAVVLVLAKREKHDKFISRLLLVAEKYGIVVWTMSEDMEIKRICG